MNRPRSCHGFALLAAIPLLLPSDVQARILNVPDDYPQIQLAIEDALDTDTVLVAPGTYDETIDFLGKAIVVGSWLITTGDPHYTGLTIIDPSVVGLEGSIVTFSNGEGSASLLRGLTIQNGTAPNGGGIYCMDTSPTILDNLIRGNQAELCGGGIYDSLGGPHIAGNVIASNAALVMDGGGFFCLYAAPEIVDNQVNDNVAGYRGAGIYCEHSSPTISDNVVFGNSGPSYYGGGIASRNCESIITDNIIYENDGGGYGGGLFY